MLEKQIMNIQFFCVSWILLIRMTTTHLHSLDMWCVGRFVATIERRVCHCGQICKVWMGITHAKAVANFQIYPIIVKVPFK